MKKKPVDEIVNETPEETALFELKANIAQWIIGLPIYLEACKTVFDYPRMADSKPLMDSKDLFFRSAQNIIEWAFNAGADRIVIASAISGLQFPKSETEGYDALNLILDQLDAGKDIPRPPSFGKNSTKEKPQAKEANIDQKMWTTMNQNPESRNWSVRQWAEHLNCTLAAVHKTKSWKTLMSLREQRKAERMERQGNE